MRCYVVEDGCLGHSGASTISSQVHDGNCTDSWQNLATKPWAPTPVRRQAPVTLIHSGKQRVGTGGKKMLNAPHIIVTPSSRHTDKKISTTTQCKWNSMHAQVWQNHWQCLATLSPQVFNTANGLQNFKN